MCSPSSTLGTGKREGKMIIRVGFSLFTVVIVTMVFLAVPSSTVFADEQIRVQSMIQAKEKVEEPTLLRLRLRNQLKKETGLSEDELDAVDPLLAQALDLNGGDTEPIRLMMRKAVQVDCVGECLKERLRNHNRLILQEHAEAGEKAAVASRERDRIRTGTRDHEQSDDQARTETRTQDRTRDGSADGGGRGSGKGR